MIEKLKKLSFGCLSSIAFLSSYYEESNAMRVMQTYRRDNGIDLRSYLKYLNIHSDSKFKTELSFSNQEEFSRNDYFSMMYNSSNLLSLNIVNIEIHAERDFIVHFPNLKNLTLFNTHLTNLEHFPEMPLLESLCLAQNPLQSFNGLERFQELKKLNLRNTNLRSLVSLPEIRTLEELNLNNNELESLRGLEKFPNLKVLKLGNNRIRSFRDFPQLEHLEVLELDRNHFVSNEGMADLAVLFPNLKELSLKFTGLFTLRNFPMLVNLEVLKLDHNFLISADGLENFPNLRILRMHCNRLITLRDFPQLENLEVLDVSTNRLGTADGLENFPNLRRLNMSFTNINSFQGFPSFFPSLGILNLYGNQFSVIDDMNGMPQFPGLVELDISNNPISERSVAYITGHLPQDCEIYSSFSN